MPVDKSEIDPSTPQATPAPAADAVFPRPQKYGFWNNLGAGGESMVAGILGLPGDISNSVYNAFQTTRAAHEQGLQGGIDPISGGPTGLYTNSSGDFARPNMEGYSTKTPIPTGKEIEPFIQDQVKNYTNFDGSDVGQRPLFSFGGAKDYSGMAAPYLLGSIGNPTSLFRAAPAAAKAIPEVAPIVSRILTQLPRTAADSFISSAATTPGDLTDRTIAGAESAAVGVPRTITGEIGATALKRLIGRPVKIGGDPNTGEPPLAVASQRQVGLAGQQLRQDLGQSGADFIRNLPATDPEIPGMQFSIGEHLPNDPKAVKLDRTAQTKNPERFDNLASSQSAAVQDANRGLATGGSTQDLTDRLNNAHTVDFADSMRGFHESASALEAQIKDFNARVGRFDKSGDDVSISTGQDSRYVDVPKWLQDHPDLAKSAHVQRWAADLDQAQHTTMTNNDRLSQAYNPPEHLMQLMGGDPDKAVSHIFTPQVLNSTGGVEEDSASRMAKLISQANKPTDTSSWGSRNGTDPSADQAMSGIKTMVSDFVGKNYLSKPLSDTTQAANFQNFVTTHEGALRQSMGDEGYKVYQAIADRMAQRASVPSNFNTPVALPREGGGVMHGLTAAAGSGGAIGTVGVIALEQVAEHLGSGILSVAAHVGGSVGTAVATGAAVGAGVVTAGKVIANAAKAANIKTQADLIALAVRYPETVGKKLLEAVPPTGMSDRMARGIARAIGGAYAQDQKHQRDDESLTIPSWATDPEVPDWAK